ncbi:SDR family oxidoreductase [Allokutzneria sp. NRRL B-24872]|uniref:SDR family oxidoreductase n=1 Tax=Allokutzneria sp. NRRL B-24872 TaxID=1137961 RepID=UPI000A36488B|nr:SDR family oxidoreductase [Allokutzneria sp. NRRL B-24872]
MRIVIAGGHGQIALHLERHLAARGDTSVGIIRNPGHADDLRAAGAEAAVLDLESATAEQVADVVRGADAVVFAAGAGPGSGTARKLTVDRDAAALLAEGAQLAGVRRYLMISAMNADITPPPDMDETFATYLRAKSEADADVRGRDLDWTVLRPGALTNEPATGRVRIAEKLPRGSITREDVALVLLELLDSPETVHRQVEVTGGEQSVAEAVAQLAHQGDRS